MIKLKHILTEKKELGGSMIYQIDKATDRNNHNEARRLLAVSMGIKKLAKFPASFVLNKVFESPDNTTRPSLFVNVP